MWQTPPVARAVEKDWIGVQELYLLQVARLQGRIAKKQRTSLPPVIVAGDVFNHHNPSPEIVNTAIHSIPDCYAVPGQHDLPNHRLPDIHKTGYWTLVAAGKIKHLCPDEPVEVDGPGGNIIVLHGFPWGTPPTPLRRRATDSLVINIAVVHDYLWIKNKGHKDASNEKRLANRYDQFAGYDFVVSGDNHQHFYIPAKDGRPAFWNCGPLLVRTQEERKYVGPTIGMLMSDGSVAGWGLDCEADKFSKLDTKTADKIDDVNTAGFIEELQQLGDTAADFSEAVKRFMDKYNKSDAVREMINELLPRKAK